MSRTLVIGVGNALRGDDAAGLHVARQLAARGFEEVHESSGETASLMELWQGAACVLLADAAQSGADAGLVARLNASSQPLPAAFLHCSTHAFGVAEAVELSRSLGSLPPQMIVFGIEGANFEHGAPLSPEVEAGVRKAVEMIEAELNG
ncbi:MAG: hydrogenase maturation protease [Verrucomicrobiales bacterium]|jgi:hydrogenase maturation protease|nr:hydrogenase maturation protease [Verrucomicrobiales bacterium]